VNCEIVIERIDAGVFGSLRSPLPALQPDELRGHADLAGRDVEVASAESDKFTPPHAAVHGKVDEGP